MWTNLRLNVGIYSSALLFAQLVCSGWHQQQRTLVLLGRFHMNALSFRFTHIELVKTKSPEFHVSPRWPQTAWGHLLVAWEERKG